MKKVYAINGSPRRNKNTAQMLDKALEGVKAEFMELWENFLTWYYSKPLIAYAFNTYQFDDYSKYICETFNEKDKAKQREEQFPKDLQNAYELGQKLLKQEI